MFITKNHEHYIEKSSFYLQEELARKCHLAVWEFDGKLSDILPQLPFQPDFILVNDLKPDYSPLIWGLKESPVPYGIIIHDLQYKIYRRKQFIEKENIQTLFSVYRDTFKKWYPEYTDRMIWLPHHVNINIYKDYQLPKEISWLMAGSLNPHLYPFRTQMHHFLKNEKAFVSYAHPGYRNIMDENGWLLGERYAKEINRSKMLLTCDSVYRFPVLKYFEAAACKTLVLGPSSKELEALGFIDRQTFISVSEHDFKEKAMYYLNDKEARESIAEKAYNMVRERHSTEVRVHQLLTHIEEIVRRSNG
ncbi:glycosyltransferase [Fictibacillus enclensis]|uniref:glycosyltransferase family protein n=1 Tax=Fictibacillus enclensis TaxID=1017270 RepID=UPI0025A10107|nr:glycosyltransferase [Fictibacillus enclensis]MDM5337851.1 glycosyltransferase [Fictibacillus enclensis]